MKKFFQMLSLSLAAVGLLLAAEAESAERLLRGALVWEYDDGAIVVRHNGVDQYYIPGGPGHHGGDGDIGGNCPSLPSESPIAGDQYLHTEVQSPSRTAGGGSINVDTSSFFSVKQVQIRVLRGSVQIHSAEAVSKLDKRLSLSSLVATRLCDGQAVLTTVSDSSLKSVSFRIEGYSDDTQVEINVSYDNARCGGCNGAGCWIEGGGCNGAGCWFPGGGCNGAGCWTPGGGCNGAGCWYAGGSCDGSGCIKRASADAGRAPTHPVCE